MKKMSIWTWLGAVFPILFLFLMMSVFHMKVNLLAVFKLFTGNHGLWSTRCRLCTDFNCTWCSAIMVRHNHPFRTCLGKHLRNLCLSVGCSHHTVRNTENI